MSKPTKLVPNNYNDNPDNILEEAVGRLDDVLILGYDKEDKLWTSCSTGLTGHNDLVYLLERVKHKILSGDYGEEKHHEDS